MKLLIASDIHGSAAGCRKLLEAWDREKPERVLLLGDILYHGPRNDLPEEYAPRAVIAMLNERREALLCIRGNCDTEVDQMVLDFATHGHVYNTEHLPPLQPGEILLHGHTHIPAWEDHGSFRYFNPGSVSIPKGGSGPCLMVYQNGVFTWKTPEGQALHTEAVSPD